MTSYPHRESVKQLEHAGYPDRPVQVRVDARDTSIRHLSRDSREPTLGLPLEGVFAPQALADIASEILEKDLRAFGYRDFTCLATICQGDRFE